MHAIHQYSYCKICSLVILRVYIIMYVREWTYRVVDWASRDHFMSHEWSEYFSANRREELSMDVTRTLRGCLALFSTGRVIITDRLHATILAILANKAVVYIDPLTGKISKALSVAFNSSSACQDFSAMNYRHATDITSAIRIASQM
jgi:exopolysaccharide biosynthesis predicted pyruvyltransferase EpsI